MLLQKTRTGKIVEFENYQCEYSILKTPSLPGNITYGIAVNFYTDGLLTDSCYIKDITTSKEKVDRLIRVLMNGFVTPMTCYDVIDDFLAIY